MGHDTPGHVVLLGDSIFDNKVYVGSGPDVVSQLRQLLPGGWKATLLAVDGDVAAGVPRQLRRLPSGATHLVISVGGNDALRVASLLNERPGSVAEALLLLRGEQEPFARDYAAMLDEALSTGLPTAVCTVYDTPPSEPAYPVIRTGLAVFNDVITRAAFRRGIPLIDLRLICDEDADYANPIEPSVQGGAKIASAIRSLVLGRHTPGSSVVATASPAG
ncbi:SGNH/GDSL hydrolase family protein [Naasia sp. SYSU D00948]|uniref:SGNH/GDSL hydrolase family protein n=1 Tax=Naasia sp. SYSU D00948 TaxID=2817379 RepID=UPI001B3158E7|nr:SGNH/GDSL hydrolase family protein [Naasia sp. SYSU D00948]